MSDERARKRREAGRDIVLVELDAFIAKVIEDYEKRVPYFAQLEERQQVDSIMVVRWGILWVLRMWVDEAPMSSEDLEVLRSLAVRRAKEGRPLEAILNTWSSGFRTIGTMLESSAADVLTTADLAGYTLMSIEAHDHFTQVFSTAYNAAIERMGRDAAGAGSQFVVDILRGRPASNATLVERGERVGVTLPADPALVALAVVRRPLRAPTPAQLDELLAAVTEADGPADRRTDSGRGVLRAVDGGAAAVIASRPTAQAIADLAGRDGWYGALIGVHEWTDCAPAHQVACVALETAPGWAFTERRTLTQSDCLVIAMVQGDSEGSSQTVSRELLGEVLTPKNIALRESLEAYLATGSMRAAAEQLHVHEQTLRYRMKQVEELTGRDVHSPWDAFILKFASAALPWTAA